MNVAMARRRRPRYAHTPTTRSSLLARCDRRLRLLCTLCGRTILLSDDPEAAERELEESAALGEAGSMDAILVPTLMFLATARLAIGRVDATDRAAGDCAAPRSRQWAGHDGDPADRFTVELLTASGSLAEAAVLVGAVEAEHARTTDEPGHRSTPTAGSTAGGAGACMPGHRPSSPMPALGARRWRAGRWSLSRSTRSPTDSSAHSAWLTRAIAAPPTTPELGWVSRGRCSCGGRTPRCRRGHPRDRSRSASPRRTARPATCPGSR